MKKDFIKIFVFLSALWVIHILQDFRVFDISYLVTSQDNGLYSIITGTFIHLNYAHLSSNTSALIVSLPLLLRFYKNEAFLLIVLGIIVPSSFAYILGRDVAGISGLAYALTWFLIFIGLKSKDSFKFILSIVLALFYAKTLIGITPAVGFGIAWQSHLAGFLLAIVLAIRK